jgi:hypothetical protein
LLDVEQQRRITVSGQVVDQFRKLGAAVPVGIQHEEIECHMDTCGRPAASKRFRPRQAPGLVAAQLRIAVGVELLEQRTQLSIMQRGEVLRPRDAVERRPQFQSQRFAETVDDQLPKAAASLEEGMIELLTIHKLGLREEFSRSFSTTNCIESLNSNLVKYIGKVKHWSCSDQRYRWVIAALMIIEHRMCRVVNYKKLYLMQDALQREVQKRFSSGGHAHQKKNLSIKKQSLSSS